MTIGRARPFDPAGIVRAILRAQEQERGERGDGHRAEQPFRVLRPHGIHPNDHGGRVWTVGTLPETSAGSCPSGLSGGHRVVPIRDGAIGGVREAVAGQEGLQSSAILADSGLTTALGTRMRRELVASGTERRR